LSPVDTASSSRFDVTLTGNPLWLLREYVESVGGQLAIDGALNGEGWQARLTQVDDYQIGSLRVGRVSLELTGTPAAVDRTRRALEPKLLRAGG
jgi:Domain of unknown function (DUF1952)